MITLREMFEKREESYQEYCHLEYEMTQIRYRIRDLKEEIKNLEEDIRDRILENETDTAREKEPSFLQHNV